MVVAVADVDDAVSSHVNSMWPTEPALERISIGAIARLSVTDQRFDLSGQLMNDADAMIFGIAEQDVSLMIDGDSFGSRKLSQPGVPSVTRISLLACSGDVMQRFGRSINAVNGVSFSQDNDEVSFRS